MASSKSRTPKAADADKARDDRTKAWLRDTSERATALRNKDREFNGLEREFVQLQRRMIAEYEASKDIKHPRDVGARREEILATFLRESGYMPRRFAVSDRSVRVAASSGHLSAELDIVISDAQESLSLMRRGDVYEVLPVETVLGVIQVKSRLNKAEIADGLKNIASFKRLDRPVASAPMLSLGKPKAERGFGLLFAYDSDLTWLEIIGEIESFARNNPNKAWCNAVFILKQGLILHGQAGSGFVDNAAIEGIADLTMMGVPDNQDSLLYQFYSMTLDLCRGTSMMPPGVQNYFRMPLTAGEYSYTYNMGMFSEVGVCDRANHGDFQRKIPEEKLKTDCRLVPDGRTHQLDQGKPYSLRYGGGPGRLRSPTWRHADL